MVLWTLRDIVDGLAENTLDLLSFINGGGGGVGGELMLDVLPVGDVARSSSGGPTRSSSEGVDDLFGTDGPDERERNILSWGLSNDAGGSRSFSISERRASSKLIMAFFIPSAPRASVP